MWGRTYGQKQRAKIMITTGRDWGSAEWINVERQKSLFLLWSHSTLEKHMCDKIYQCCYTISTSVYAIKIPYKLYYHPFCLQSGKTNSIPIKIPPSFPFSYSRSIFPLLQEDFSPIWNCCLFQLLSESSQKGYFSKKPIKEGHFVKGISLSALHPHNICVI